MSAPLSAKVGTLAVALVAAAVPAAPSALAAPAAPAVPAAANVSALDRTFVEDAGHGGAYEVAAGRLAAARAAEPALRSFGTRMVTDHTSAGAALKTLAGGLGLTVPATPDSNQQAILALWGSMSGSAFDCSYAPAAYADHVGDVGLFEREAADGRNAKLRTFARDTLPALQQHLAMAAANLRRVGCAGALSVPTPTPTFSPRPTRTPWPTFSPRPPRTPWPTFTVRPTHRPTAWPTPTMTVRPTVSPRSTPTVLPTLGPWPTLPWPTRTPLPTSIVIPVPLPSPLP